MAEISAIASIIGVAGAGAKLSLLLYELAASVASARGDILSLGRDVVLFCAVLKQVGSVLESQKAARFSSTAVGTTVEIVERCKVIFEELNVIVRNLKYDRGDGKEAAVGFVARVRWTFKRSRVRLLQGSLDSMKITLHLMLTTLDFSEKVYSRRNSCVQLSNDDDGELQDEEEQVQSVAESLVIAQQLSIETLQELEEKDEDNENEIEHQYDILEAGPSGNDNDSARNVTTKISMASVTTNRTMKEKVSVWLSEIVSQASFSRPGTHVSQIDKTYQQPLILAGRWTMESRAPKNNEPTLTTYTNTSTAVSTSEIRISSPTEFMRMTTRQAKPISKGEVRVVREREVEQPKPLQPSRYPESSFSHAFERWELLSAHWEGLTSFWIRRLEENPDEIRGLPLSMQLSRQVTDMAATGANLFHAVVELQRLRASSERKFQRWFFEMRAEQERWQEIQARLEAELQEERRVTKEEQERARAEAARVKQMMEELRQRVLTERKKRGEAIRLLAFDTGLEQAMAQEEYL